MPAITLQARATSSPGEAADAAGRNSHPASAASAPPVGRNGTRKSPAPVSGFPVKNLPVEVANHLDQSFRVPLG